VTDNTAQNDMRQCKYCGQLRARIFSGMKLKDGSKIHVDDNGARWSGARCPSCEKKRVQAAVKHDQFDRKNLIDSFEKEGYTVKNSTSPLVVEKDGETKTITIRRAYTNAQGNIVAEKISASEAKADMTALLFQTVKICTKEQMERLEEKFELFQKTDERSSRRKRKAPEASL
jgi:hypothetical protein